MQFSVGSVLGVGLRMWLRCLWRLGAVIVVGFAPVLAVVVHLVTQGSPQARADALHDLGALAVSLILLLELPVTAIITHAAVGDLRGQQPSRAASIRAGLRRTPHAVLVMAMIYLVVLATAFVAALPLAAAGQHDILVLVRLLWLGYVISLAARWSVAVPAAVVERPGILGALNRSNELTAGRRSRLAVLVLVVGAIHVAVVVAVAALTGSHHDGPLGDADVLACAILLLAWIPLSVLRAVVAAVAYAFIVADVEGDSPERLGEVFG